MGINKYYFKEEKKQTNMKTKKKKDLTLKIYKYIRSRKLPK